jgi:archaellum component FlaG (FlaF/FlaG flagellin family)
MARSRAGSLRTTYALLVALIAATVTVPAVVYATGSSPGGADKTVASGSKLEVIAPQADATLLTATIQTSTPEDLEFSVSAECDVLTSLTTTGSQSSEAQGNVQIWVTIDGNIVPINSVSSPPQSQTGSRPGTMSDSVTFCHRDASQTFTDGDATSGSDTLTEYQDTKNAASFSWVWLNAGAGTHTIVVHGQLTNTTGGSGSATADAYVGNRMLVVTPTKFSNSATI